MDGNLSKKNMYFRMIVVIDFDFTFRLYKYRENCIYINSPQIEKCLMHYFRLHSLSSLDIYKSMIH